jgi:hypothetical protein
MSVSNGIDWGVVQDETDMGAGWDLDGMRCGMGKVRVRECVKR